MPATRDPFGLIPVYAHRRTAATSSCLYDLLDPQPRRDAAALLEYVLFGDVWGSTLFADIQRVAPSATAPSTELVDRDERTLVDLFWSTLSDAVARSIGPRGDIVVAISGGLDAAALAAAYVERFGAARVRAATVGQPGDEETSAAQASADALGIELLIVEPDDRVVDWPTHELWPALPRTATERAWEKLTTDAIVVWGIGGDSVQRGDRRHYAERLRRHQWREALVDIARAMILHGCKPALGLQAALAGPVRAAKLPAWLDGRFADDAKEIAERRASQSNFRRGVDEMYAPSWAAFFEWMAPQHNDPPIAHRFPFFDVELVDLLATVPTAPWCVGKNLLRAALRGRLPDSVRLRPKSPAARPAMIEWDNGFASELNAFLDASAYTTRQVESGVFARGEVEGMLRCAAAARWEER